MLNWSKAQSNYKPSKSWSFSGKNMKLFYIEFFNEHDILSKHTKNGGNWGIPVYFFVIFKSKRVLVKYHIKVGHYCWLRCYSSYSYICIYFILIYIVRVSWKKSNGSYYTLSICGISGENHVYISDILSSCYLWDNNVNVLSQYKFQSGHRFKTCHIALGYLREV